MKRNIQVGDIIKFSFFLVYIYSLKYNIIVTSSEISENSLMKNKPLIEKY